MSRKKFSIEELEELCSNPHVASVLNGYQVEFTAEFKKIAYQELIKGNRTMREILQEYGINTKLLGDKRIWTLTHKLRQTKGIVGSSCSSKKKVSQNVEDKAKSSKKSENSQDILRRCDLRNNPYVADVINDKITFTEQFKDLAAREFVKSTKTAREILQDFGFDVQLLGENRIAHFASILRKRCTRLVESQHDFMYNIPRGEKEGTITMKTSNSSENRTELRIQEQTSDIKAGDVFQTNQNIEISQKSFTEEERLSLLNNQYVSSITNDSVQFTEAFKELAHDAFLQGGKTMREIFQEHGTDPEILGSKRIWNFTSKLQEKAKKSQGFEDARKHNKRRPAITPTEEKALTVRVRDLEHELAYTRQEVEFLKKTQMVDMEARILWESKQNQKKNSH